MLDLIQTRRDLHQIQRLAWRFKTQAYLLDVIEKLTTGKDFVQIRTWRTGILVYLQEVSRSEPLVGGQILMACLSSNKQVYLLLLNTRSHACLWP